MNTLSVASSGVSHASNTAWNASDSASDAEQRRAIRARAAETRARAPDLTREFPSHDEVAERFMKQFFAAASVGDWMTLEEVFFNDSSHLSVDMDGSQEDYHGKAGCAGYWSEHAGADWVEPETLRVEEKIVGLAGAERHLIHLSFMQGHRSCTTQRVVTIIGSGDANGHMWYTIQRDSISRASGRDDGKRQRTARSVPGRPASWIASAVHSIEQADHACEQVALCASKGYVPVVVDWVASWYEKNMLGDGGCLFFTAAEVLAWIRMKEHTQMPEVCKAASSRVLDADEPPSHARAFVKFTAAGSRASIFGRAPVAEIALDRRIFDDECEAVWTLAHELMHVHVHQAQKLVRLDAPQGRGVPMEEGLCEFAGLLCTLEYFQSRQSGRVLSLPAYALNKLAHMRRCNGAKCKGASSVGATDRIISAADANRIHYQCYLSALVRKAKSMLSGGGASSSSASLFKFAQACIQCGDDWWKQHGCGHQ